MLSKMEILFIKKFFKGIELPQFSISLEDSVGVFALREKKKIKNYIIEGLNDDLVRLVEGEWKIGFEGGKIYEILKKIKSKKRIDSGVLLIPDFLTNTFIISFESLPKNKSEAENLIRWRVEKQFPMKGDIILRYHLFRKNKGVRVLAVSIPKSIIQQFISIFEKGGIKINFISIPILTLYNFIRNISTSKNGIIIVNRYKKGTSFFGFSNSFPLIFRSKIGNLTRKEIMDEALSTMRWMQEKESVKTDEIWIRDISDEKWEDLERPFLSVSSLEGKIRDVKFLSPHLGIPEWTE